jgi:hypothetical protein
LLRELSHLALSVFRAALQHPEPDDHNHGDGDSKEERLPEQPLQSGTKRCIAVGNGLALTVVGLVTGGIAAVLASRALSSYLYGVTPTDPATLAVVVIGVSLVALVACYQPARSASRVDPMTILRRE